MTLPRVFVSMTGGRLWGALFFLFLTFASFTTVLAVFENIMASCMDNFGWSRKKATIVCGIFILLASMPCVLGYNLWYFEASLPSGATGQILDIEDFLVSNLLLPIGSLIYLLFCVSKWGWGFDKYLAEANKGTGLRQLCKALDVKPEEVMAFGDNFNDLPMLEAAGCPYIMDNAAPELRAKFPNHCRRVEDVLRTL